MKLYEELAEHVAALVATGILRPGDRLPSVRQLCRDRRVSVATVMRAYEVLEARGVIETRPQSGHYVSLGARNVAPRPARAVRTTRVDVSELVFEILDAVRDREVVPLGSAFPSPTLFPWQKLARHLGSAARHMDPWSTVQSLPPGSAELRRQIARRYLRFGIRVLADEIVITNGALEALNLSLQAVDAARRRRRDRVAELLRVSTGHRIARSTRRGDPERDPREGVDLGALERAIDSHKVRACWFMTTFQNPLGATMPDDKKRDWSGCSSRATCRLSRTMCTRSCISAHGGRRRRSRSMRKGSCCTAARSRSVLRQVIDSAGWPRGASRETSSAARS